MKRFIAVLVFAVVAFSCSKEKGNMVVKGQIKGLKKGTLYLQKMNDTLLVSVDSVKLFGDDKFLLSDNVESPVMYYLTFDGNTQEKKIMFFGEPGEITINDNVEEFGWKPGISGSKNQEVMDKFNEINQQFKLKRLDFIAKDMEARAKKDTAAMDSLEKEYKKMVRRRFLFTTNFAVANPDTEAAPYIALSELFDANLYLLDTINNSLTSRVKSSDYGMRLQKFIDDVKAQEKK
ncbi:DUF4369 domain-containing protein [Tenacibaculum sp. IB213877]|uniref:DUF4369 domain-containing protein n=1 Tax=Tenacibaculum sp. IB213877 TaxID=3097351 RepID=UPI002A59C3CB|nr:DUF4369 domain-containing protein [Tenacibaculum sp. IB213877]MDY0781069.1 DUF4369 domain-containing protein [Tenacibaculum sp. IB213877]